ncbi:ion channel [Halomonas sp. HK25]|uniref:ion channel n=1 Tax=Halomonas sp. HK25 TaxID=3394321 RepID=UPI0039FD654A
MDHFITRGSGLLTKQVTHVLRAALACVHTLFGRRIFLVVTGPATLVLLGVVWVAGLWLGWLLIFSGLPEAVVDSQSGRPASVSELIYYVGFTLSTLGVGDFLPQGAAARLLTSVAAFNGLVLVTLIITYALPVVSAAVARRQLAFSISMLGDTPPGYLEDHLERVRLSLS